MKKVVGEKGEYFYKVYETIHLNGEKSYETIFFKEETTIRKRKWWFFGEWQEEKVPVVLFEVAANANDPKIPAAFWWGEISMYELIEERKKDIEAGYLMGRPISYYTGLKQDTQKVTEQ